MTPVILYQTGTHLPEEGTYYIVAGDGLWLHKDTGLMKGLVPVNNISVLDDLKAKTTITCSLPKVPASMVWQIQSFFREVVKKYHSEAIVQLYFNKENQNYLLVVPSQRVSHNGIRYERGRSIGNFLLVGTIHSHADFDAFHSGVDDHDEETFDGLHCTFGHNNQDEFSISASLVMNGQRVKIKPESILEGIDCNVDCDEFGCRDRYGFTVVPEDAWQTVVLQWMERVIQ